MIFSRDKVKISTVSNVTTSLEMLQKQVPALECLVCDQIVLPSELFVSDILLLVRRLEQESYGLCPS